MSEYEPIHKAINIDKVRENFNADFNKAIKDLIQPQLDKLQKLKDLYANKKVDTES